MSDKKRDTRPPPPPSGRELLAYPPRAPDWVDEVAMRAAMAAVRATRDQIESTLMPHLEGIERAVVEGFERSKRDHDELVKRLGEHQEKREAHDRDVVQLKELVSSLTKRVAALESRAEP